MKKTSTALFGAALLLFLAKEVFGSDDTEHHSYIPSGSATDYINKFSAMAKQTQQYYAVPAAVTLAQGGLESGWGTSNLARNANNHFGIKADLSWHGATYTTQDGMKYRKYSSAQDSYTDHAKFLVDNPRYDSAFNTSDPILFAQRVAAAGYAEDPNYFSKLSQILRLIA